MCVCEPTMYMFILQGLKKNILYNISVYYVTHIIAVIYMKYYLLLYKSKNLDFNI